MPKKKIRAEVLAAGAAVVHAAEAVDVDDVDAALVHAVIDAVAVFSIASPSPDSSRCVPSLLRTVLHAASLCCTAAAALAQISSPVELMCSFLRVLRSAATNRSSPTFLNRIFSLLFSLSVEMMAREITQDRSCHSYCLMMPTFHGWRNSNEPFLKAKIAKKDVKDNIKTFFFPTPFPSLSKGICHCQFSKSYFPVVLLMPFLRAGLPFLDEIETRSRERTVVFFLWQAYRTYSIPPILLLLPHRPIAPLQHSCK